MNDGPVTKKIRIWNPAVEKSQVDDTVIEKPLDCTAVKSFPMKNFFQNYMQLAPMMINLTQQRQLEEIARRQLFASFQMATHASRLSELAPSQGPSPAKAASSTANPIVQSVLGQTLINENCCAVCGAAFRLTGDLVQHMRNNHRKSKFKRKNDHQ
ncbi:unnamed protein product [Caenorhabditis auriculariae]|uniref:C2H2-type domain-containing protein n=1 Tax=Caenorhabditis auriculariae TaxID=2777116 RepID=A0A8S1H834_9PELO|nr:unnamed protein product [Caenorhabditis auriculariae]